MDWHGTFGLWVITSSIIWPNMTNLLVVLMPDRPCSWMAIGWVIGSLRARLLKPNCVLVFVHRLLSSFANQTFGFCWQTSFSLNFNFSFLCGIFGYVLFTKLPQIWGKYEIVCLPEWSWMQRKWKAGNKFETSAAAAKLNTVLLFDTVCLFVCLDLLAPTGALIVIVCYYRSKPVFEISSISANIFLFWKLNADW